MNTLRTLVLLAAGLSVALSTSEEPVASDRSPDLFRNHILCLMPDSWPIFDNAEYGCYCGVGSSGTPVDELDRCCQVHDNCYGEAMQLDECCSIFHNRYTKSYSHVCAKASKTTTSEESDYACETFICECDRVASECFARSPWNPEHEHLPSDRCQ